MSLEVLAKLPPALLRGPPRFRVRCPDCRSEYVVTGWDKQVARTPRCASCSHRGKCNSRWQKQKRGPRGWVRA